jgi:translation initiation factor 1
MKSKKRIPTDGESIPWKSPFAGLKDLDIPLSSAPPETGVPSDQPSAPARSTRGRVDIIRQTAHRGGKVVTVVTGFVGIGQAEKERLAQAMQRACGAGGTVKEGRIEIQGDQRDVIAQILSEAGFRPVFAGG